MRGYVLSYVGASESLVSEYCRGRRLCFWADYAAVTPAGTRDVYFFDCSMYRFAREQYSQSPETRLVLSFKSPATLDQLFFTVLGAYSRVESETTCDKRDVEECLARISQEIERAIDEARDYISRLREPPSWLRFLFPIRGAKAEAKAVYYGLLARRDMYLELASLLGYRDGRLDAQVKHVSVLLSLDLNRGHVYALVGSRAVKLDAHKKIVDFEKVLSRIARRE
jgi:hypothetical protein